MASDCDAKRDHGGGATSERAATFRLLEAERAQIEGRLASLDRSLDELLDDSRDATPDDEHDPEGTTAYDRAQVSALRAASRQRLKQVESALTNINAADFGACTRCRGAIGRERLAALPGVDLCVACAAVTVWRS